MNEKSKMIVRQTVCLTEELERELADAAERTDLAKQDVIRLCLRIGLVHLKHVKYDLAACVLNESKKRR